MFHRCKEDHIVILDVGEFLLLVLRRLIWPIHAGKVLVQYGMHNNLVVSVEDVQALLFSSLAHGE